MRSIYAMAAIILLSGCVSYSPTFPAADVEGPETLQLVPILSQEEMAVQVVVADSSAVTAQYGLIGALVGSVMDAAMNNSRAKKAERKAEVLRAAAQDYDLIANLSEAIRPQAESTNWIIGGVGDVTAETDWSDNVERALAEGDADTAVLLSGTYQLVPTSDQISVVIDQRVYPKDKRGRSGRYMASSSRRFTYHSPVHPLDLRPFGDGEKELLKSAISLEYEQAIATQMDEEDDLRRALERELEEIDEATNIPEDIAISETWTPELIARYLDEAQSHLSHLIAVDWNEVESPEMTSDVLEDFWAVGVMGTRLRQKGLRLDTLDSNVLYRSRDGSLYSVPPAP